jgi:DNA-binding NarL/FixJ family response regulator
MKPKRAAIQKKILLVDDHPLTREGVARWIDRTAGMTVCGQASSGAEAVELTLKLNPDAVVLDVSLPDRDGLDVLKDLRTAKPQLAVLVLSMYDEALYAGRALRAGARGYMVKGATGERVVHSLREIFDGRTAFSAEFATQLIEQCAGARREDSLLPRLTRREFEVFQLLADVRTTREIAAQLGLSPKTVETHRLSLIRKFKLRNSAELLRFAVQSLDKPRHDRREPELAQAF